MTLNKLLAITVAVGLPIAIAFVVCLHYLVTAVLRWSTTL